MKLTVHHDPGAFALLARDWTALLPHVRHNHIFATPQWAETWWRSFGPGKELHILTAIDDDGLAGVAPLYVREQNGRRYVRLVGGIDVTDYTDIVARAGAEQAVLEQALAYLDGIAWDELDLHNVPEQSATLAFFRSLAEQPAWDVSIDIEDVCPRLVALPGDWETYVACLEKKDRHELRRKLRRLEGAAPPVESTCRIENLEQAVDEFVRLHRLSSADKAEFMQARMVEFFHDIARVCHQAGWLKLCFMAEEGRNIAATMAFDYGDTLYLYNSGYDPAYDHLSVGLLQVAYAIRRAIADGRRTFDFLQGNERYKYDLGGKDSRVWSIRCHKRSR